MVVMGEVIGVWKGSVKGGVVVGVLGLEQFGLVVVAVVVEQARQMGEGKMVVGLVVGVVVVVPVAEVIVV